MPASVAIASCRDPRLVERLLRALEPALDRGVEVVVARAGEAGDVAALEGRHPRVRFVRAAPGTAVPALRGLAMQATTGDPVLVTEDHLVPAPDWMDRLLPALGPGIGAAGGGMANGEGLGLLAWAAYFSDYGFYSRARRDPPGTTPLLTAANIAYPRRVVADVAAWSLAGEWENVLHDRLRAQGERLAFVPDAVVYHVQRYGLVEFCRDRYEHGLEYARSRLAEHPESNRWLLLVLAPLLAGLLFLRIGRAAWRERPLLFAAAAPLTLVLLGWWAIGEAVGYGMGPARGQAAGMEPGGPEAQMPATGSPLQHQGPKSLR